MFYEKIAYRSDFYTKEGSGVAVYLKINTIYNKFKKAEEENKVLFISAPCGYGKSAAFEYYYRRKPYFQMSGRSGSLDKMPSIDSIRQSVVLFDDVCFLTDDISKQYVLNMIYNGQKTVIMMGRGALPIWLVQADVKLEFIRADKRDLKFTSTETKEYLEKMGYDCSLEMAEVLTEKLAGHPLLIMFYTKNISGEVEYSEDAYGRALRELYHYFDEAIWKVWMEDIKKALLATCEFETYTVELIERITGMEKLADLVEYAYNIGNFITYLGNGFYKIDSVLRDYVLWKRSFIYSQQDLEHLYKTAAEYYDEIRDVEHALEYYSKAKLEHKITELLVRNANCDPARAQLFKAKKYLFSLKEEQVEHNPALMASVSLLYSVEFSPDESEKWYNRLVDYANNKCDSEQERKTVQNRLLFLDMSLMHRIPYLRIDSIYRTAEVVKRDHIQVPEMAITGNAPSVLNGSIDFSFYLKYSKKERVKIQKPLKDIYGRFAKPLYEVGNVECMIEQNTGNTFDIMKILNEAYVVCDAMGRMEVCFVCVVLLTRLHLNRGQINVAKEQIESFNQKIKKENAGYLMPNMNAFSAWLLLLQGNTGLAKEWLKEAPDENIEFYIMERYRYIHKVRFLIATGNMEHAYSLIKRLNLFFVEYHREYYYIQSRVLEAILVYRLGDGRWENILLEALEKAEEHQYVRVIADEGTAIVPLLSKLKSDVLKKAFVKKVMSEADKMAKMYPDYMEPEFKLKEPLTKKEIEILDLMHSGKKSEEICEICNISYSGLKFHNRNIYRKLGVSSRQEAERKAVLLRIVD